MRRKLDLFRALRNDVILIHRELTPIGPPVFEWILTKVFRKKIIYDFDDAIWMNDGHDGKLTWGLKSRRKIRKICQWSWKVSVGNEFLAEYARQYCDQVVVIPTVVDTEVHKPINRAVTLRHVQSDKIVLGWTGSHSTLFYLNATLTVIKELQKKHDFTFLVIANRDPLLPLKNYQFIKWSKDTEVEDLQRIDIGIMPLEDTEWARGKCGFKLIQYGAIGIPSVASAVGTNIEVIEEGVSGFLISEIEHWKQRLEELLVNEELRKKMGAAARKKIETHYSVSAIHAGFIKLFKD